jgi:AcrR family transcriptional regulator
MSYWTAEPRGRERKRLLTSGALAEAAVRVLDAEGTQALSMRRLADELGVAQSSLYGHVRGRDDLLDLALDHALARELEELTRAAGADLAMLAVAWFHHLTRHPWAASLVLERTLLGPSYLTLADRLCHLLHAAGTPADNVLGLAYAVTAMAAGHAIAHENARADIGYDAVDLAPYPNLAAATGAFAQGWPDVVRGGVASLLARP